LAPFLPVDSNKPFDDDVQVKVTIDEDKGTGPRALKAISEAHGLVVRLNAMGSFLLSERLLRTQPRVALVHGDDRAEHGVKLVARARTAVYGAQLCGGARGPSIGSPGGPVLG
jgi:hypothetical protein